LRLHAWEDRPQRSFLKDNRGCSATFLSQEHGSSGCPGLQRVLSLATWSLAEPFPSAARSLTRATATHRELTRIAPDLSSDDRLREAIQCHELEAGLLPPSLSELRRTSRRFAPRNDERKISDSTVQQRRDARLLSRGAIASGFCKDIALDIEEGAGKAGRWPRPWPACKQKAGGSHGRSGRSIPALPARWF
jgi:hypothetical protein